MCRDTRHDEVQRVDLEQGDPRTFERRLGSAAPGVGPPTAIIGTQHMNMNYYKKQCQGFYVNFIYSYCVYDNNL